MIIQNTMTSDVQKRLRLRIETTNNGKHRSRICPNWNSQVHFMDLTHFRKTACWKWFFKIILEVHIKVHLQVPQDIQLYICTYHDPCLDLLKFEQYIFMTAFMTVLIAAFMTLSMTIFVKVCIPDSILDKIHVRNRGVLGLLRHLCCGWVWCYWELRTNYIIIQNKSFRSTDQT